MCVSDSIAANMENSGFYASNYRLDDQQPPTAPGYSHAPPASNTYGPPPVFQASAPQPRVEYGYTAPYASYAAGTVSSQSLSSGAASNISKYFTNSASSGQQLYDPDDVENEPPLLVELGVRPEHIIQKTLAVLNPLRVPSQDVMRDADLAGPVIFGLIFGALLLLQGKLHFGYIYGIGIISCLCMLLLLNMMSGSITFFYTVSTLGYCLLPLVLLSALGIILPLKGGLFGMIVTFAIVTWCSWSASKLFTRGLNMEHQQLLVAYLCMLFYAVFSLLSIF